MLKRVKKLYRAWLAISEQASPEVLAAQLSPTGKSVTPSAPVSRFGLFHPSYESWRIKRLTKILEIYSIDFFNGRRLLEVGAGHGDIGACFADLGAEVLCLDGRVQNINFGRLKYRHERLEVDEEALEGVGSRPSPFYIEPIAHEDGYDITRYFTPDLNFGEQFCYGRKHKNDDAPNDDFVRRRFWRLTRASAESTPSRSAAREKLAHG